MCAKRVLAIAIAISFLGATENYADVVSTINPGGAVFTDQASGTLLNLATTISSVDMQALINGVGDTSFAGVFDSENVTQPATGFANFEDDPDYTDVVGNIVDQNASPRIFYGVTTGGPAGSNVSGTGYINQEFVSTGWWLSTNSTDRLWTHLGMMVTSDVDFLYEAFFLDELGQASGSTGLGVLSGTGTRWLGISAPTDRTISRMFFFSGSAGIDDVSFVITTGVPEPSSLFLTLGIGTFAVLRRRRD